MLYKLIKESFMLEKSSTITELSHNKAGNFFVDYGKDFGDFGDNKIVVEVPDDIKVFEYESSHAFIYDNHLEKKHYPELGQLATVPMDTVEEFDSLFADGIYKYFKDNNPNIAIYASQLVARLELEDEYDGAHWFWEDDLMPNQWQIWNTDLLKIKEVNKYGKRENG